MCDSDVTDEEWELIKHYFDPTDSRGGARPKHAKRDVVNAIFYLNKTGAQWRMLPEELKNNFPNYLNFIKKGSVPFILFIPG